MKIRKKKGFTLIELLAVIVILAVIALIAIPQIMNIIKLSKRNSFKATLLNIEHAAENYRIKQELYETMIGCHYFSFSEPNKEGIDEITGKKYVKLEELDLKGKLPSTGVVEVCSDTILVNASDGKFYGKVDQEKDPIISENDEAFTDETQPTMTLSYTSTESSINAIVEASIGGHGQIQDYYFSIDDSEYVKSKSPIYTYTELESGKIYKIKAYTVSKANIKSDIHEMEAMTNNIGEIKKIVILPTEWSKEKSATIEYKFDDDNANSYIQYKITRGEEVLKDWTIYGDREIKISENTTSKICLYAKVVENEIDKPNSMIYVCTSNIDNTTPTVTLTSNVENDIWTNKDIELVANASGSISNYSYEWYYETKEGNIKLKNKENNYIITKDEERTYIVKVKNESGTYSDYSNKYIVKLDKELPTKDKPTVQIIKGETTYSLKVSNNQIDEKSKIKSIEYMLSSDGENYLNQDTDLFENLIPGKTYYVKTKAIDNALNESESDITEIELKKLPGKLTLSSNADIYTYPNSNKVEILENISGGTISIDEGTDTEVATAKLSGTELTVTPGTKEGTTTFTITSAETSQFNEARVVYVATTKKGLLSVAAMPVNVIYDGKEHSITVTSSGATIRYSKDGTTYSTTNPTYTNVGTYTVYYEVSKTGYTTVKDSTKLTITKANVTVTSPTAKTLTYNGSAQNLINAGNCTGGTIKYKVGNGSYSTIIPTGTNAGSYTVAYYCEGDSNHNNSTEKTVDVKIDKASGSVTVPTVKTLTYNGSAQNLINAGSSTTGTIQYSLDGKTYSTNIPTGINAGTYTVYYRVVGDLNHTDVTAGNISVTIKKANNTLTLSANSGTYTYPTSGKFIITKNVSGGTISINAGTDTGVATAKLSGTEVTITPGTKEGTTTFTITSAETTNYNKGSVTYIATTKHGVLSVTANGYNGVYDGKAHSITVTSSGATIKYSTDGTTYGTTNPTYTNVGTYTVYYEVSKTGYTTVKGNAKVVLTKAAGSVTAPTAKSLKYNGKAQALINAGSSTTGTIQYSLDGKTYSTSIPTGTNAGTYTVYYRVIGNANYNDVAARTLSVTIQNADITPPTNVTLKITPNLTEGTRTKTVSCTGPSNCTTYTAKYYKVNYYTVTATATDAESGILKYEFYIDANNGDCGGKKCDSTQKSNPILKKTITTSSNSASFESSEYFDSSVEYIVKVYNKEGLSTTYSLNDNCSKSSTQCTQPESNAYMTDKNFFGSSSNYMWTCSSGKTWCG